ncbi:phosphopentomutase [bacterium]|nr:MAG: phosphopentomutase [bacterium]
MHASGYEKAVEPQVHREALAGDYRGAVVDAHVSGTGDHIAIAVVRQTIGTDTEWLRGGSGRWRRLRCGQGRSASATRSGNGDDRQNCRDGPALHAQPASHRTAMLLRTKIRTMEAVAARNAKPAHTSRGGCMSRAVILVMDSGGVGALPDASAFGDAPGANTIGNTIRALGGLHLPTLDRLGLAAVLTHGNQNQGDRPDARYARLEERSQGKDTITGHWEMMGIVTQVPFPTYPHGFPADVIERFTAIADGRAPLGNQTASGTEIIQRLGEEHQRTGRPILYTSADSVFQVACHEQTVPLETLYRWCEAARAMLTPPHNVNRVIARPFLGEPGRYYRTANRRDYALEPPPMLLDELSAGGVKVHAIGKISDIYCGRGVTSSERTADNLEGMERTRQALARMDHGLIFTNLNDFDSKYGHRRDVRGYGRALEQLDAALEGLLADLQEGDRLLITADHGCDPTAPGTDHTREYVPLLDYGRGRGDAGVLEGLGVVGEIVKSTLAPGFATL